MNQYDQISCLIIQLQELPQCYVGEMIDMRMNRTEKHPKINPHKGSNDFLQGEKAIKYRIVFSINIARTTEQPYTKRKP